MLKALANNAIFVVSYLVFMLPTYYFQLASKSAEIHTAPIFNAQSATLLAFMLVLCWICVVRGAYIGKHWLVALPAVAIAFAFIPKLSVIPYVSTSYHVLAIVIGLAFPVLASAQSALPNG